MLNKKISDSNPTHDPSPQAPRYTPTSPIHAMHNLSYAHISKNSPNSNDVNSNEADSQGESTPQEANKKVRIGVLALQGAFSEHCIALHKCGAIPVEIRQEKDLENIQGLILPGGESTVMVKLLCEEGLLEPLKSACQNIPILATCAGLILLAKEIQSHPDQARLGLMDIVVERNAFGRQKESFIANIPIKTPSAIQNLQMTDSLAQNDYVFPAVFIRAPQIISAKNNARVLAMENDKILAVQQNNMVACSFHPELCDDLLFHTWLIDAAKKAL